MPSFNCPNCNKRLIFKEELCGKKVLCKCGQKIRVPDLPVHSDAIPDLKTENVTQSAIAVQVAAPQPPPVPVVQSSLPVSKPYQARVNRNLYPCPACHTAVSYQAFRCPSCGHKLRQAQRGLFGQLIKWAFILFNILMIYWMYGASKVTGELLSNSQDDVQRTGTVIGAGIGMSVILFIWLAGDVILGLFVLFTRPRE